MKTEPVKAVGCMLLAGATLLAAAPDDVEDRGLHTRGWSLATQAERCPSRVIARQIKLGEGMGAAKSRNDFSRYLESVFLECAEKNTEFTVTRNGQALELCSSPGFNPQIRMDIPPGGPCAICKKITLHHAHVQITPSQDVAQIRIRLAGDAYYETIDTITQHFWSLGIAAIVKGAICGDVERKKEDNASATATRQRLIPEKALIAMLDTSDGTLMVVWEKYDGIETMRIRHVIYVSHDTQNIID